MPNETEAKTVPALSPEEAMKLIRAHADSASGDAEFGGSYHEQFVSDTQKLFFALTGRAATHEEIERMG